MDVTSIDPAQAKEKWKDSAVADRLENSTDNNIRVYQQLSMQ